MIHDTMLVVGFGCVVTGAFLYSVPVGLVVFGLPLMALAIAKRKETSSDR